MLRYWRAAALPACADMPSLTIGRDRPKPDFPLIYQNDTMNVNLLAEMNWESKLDHAMRVVDFNSLIDADYGPGLSKLTLVAICLDPAFEFKQRVRLLTATRTLYIDVMLDLPFFVKAKHCERRTTLYEQLTIQVGRVMAKRRIKDFDSKRFLQDFDNLLIEQLNGEGSSRFDSLCLERATGF